MNTALHPDGHALRGRAVVLDPADHRDAATVADLRSGGELWQVHDTLEQQLADLARTRAYGARLDDDGLRSSIDAILAGVPLDRFGRWVLYP